MPDYSVIVGDAEIISVSDGHIHFAPSDFFPSVEASEWDAYADHLTGDGFIRMNVGSFVIRVGDDVALVDTGLGEGDHPFDNSEWGLLAADMAHKGISPDEVNKVIITHLHRDHVGWNMVEKTARGRLSSQMPSTTSRKRTGTSSRAAPVCVCSPTSMNR